MARRNARDEFERTVLATATAMGADCGLVGDDLVADGRSFTLGPWRDACRLLDPERWPRVLARHLGDALLFDVGDRALAGDWAWAASRLQVRAFSLEQVLTPFSAMAARPLAGDLLQVLVVAHPQGYMQVRRSDVASWPVDEHEAFARAAGNLPLLPRLADPDEVVRLTGGPTTSGLVLRLERLVPAGAYGLVVGLPTASTVLARRLSGPEDAGAVRRLLARVRTDASGPAALSPHVFWLPADGLGSGLVRLSRPSPDGPVLDSPTWESLLGQLQHSTLRVAA